MKLHHIHHVLISAEKIRRRVDELSEEIAGACKTETPVILGILNGSFVFLADLIRGFNRYGKYPRIGFITLSSYGSGTESCGSVKIAQDTPLDIFGREVIVVDDILDSGRTLRFAKELFLARGASSVKTCVLLDKKTTRAVEIAADFTGFAVDNVFVTGYGLDYDGLYRELPHIAKVTFE
ncbi:MAG: hypoxanthine phosphoribosyltransferase [Kiritimatiellales bacterium]